MLTLLYSAFPSSLEAKRLCAACFLDIPVFSPVDSLFKIFGRPFLPYHFFKLLFSYSEYSGYQTLPLVPITNNLLPICAIGFHHSNI